MGFVLFWVFGEWVILGLFSFHLFACPPICQFVSVEVHKPFPDLFVRKIMAWAHLCQQVEMVAHDAKTHDVCKIDAVEFFDDFDQGLFCQRRPETV
jgi:hypothetical protein